MNKFTLTGWVMHLPSQCLSLHGHSQNLKYIALKDRRAIFTPNDIPWHDEAVIVMHKGLVIL